MTLIVQDLVIDGDIMAQGQAKSSLHFGFRCSVGECNLSQEKTEGGGGRESVLVGNTSAADDGPHAPSLPEVPIFFLA